MGSVPDFSNSVRHGLHIQEACTVPRQELGKLEAELEAERSQKQMVETKLEEASRALASAQEQLAQKGWEAAQALAAVNDEMHQQRSASEGRHKALEEEVVLLKTKREELQAQAGHTGTLEHTGTP